MYDICREFVRNMTAVICDQNLLRYPMKTIRLPVICSIDSRSSCMFWLIPAESTSLFTQRPTDSRKYRNVNRERLRRPSFEFKSML